MTGHPVSVIVERTITKGNKEAFETLLEEIIKASSAFPGYLDTRIQKPENEHDHTYRVLFRFDSQKNLDNWISSKERHKIVEKIDKLLEKPTNPQIITGLETWFAIPGQKSITPPPRYKMAVVTLVAITPLLMTFHYLFGDYLAKLPFVARFLVSSPCIVLIMTYFWMPLITKLFKFWLYPKKS